MFEDLDFTKLKLPIEPKNLIYIYLAYKLINNLDKLNLPKRPATPATPAINNNFIFLVILVIGGSFLFLNNILNRISFSSISVENLSAKNPNSRFEKPMPRCPMKNVNSRNLGKCPMRKCPLFSNDTDLSQMLEQCLQKCRVSDLHQELNTAREKEMVENCEQVESCCKKNTNTETDNRSEDNQEN